MFEHPGPGQPLNSPTISGWEMEEPQHKILQVDTLR